MNMQRNVLHTVLLLVFFSLWCFPQANAQEGPLILTICTQKSEPYTQVRAAFRNHLSRYFPNAEYNHYHAADDDNSLILYPETADRQPTLILSLGTKAAQEAQLYFPDTPLVATMILNDDVLDPQIPHTGIKLALTPEIQLSWLVKFLPQVKRVGVLYNPEQNSDWIIEAERVARKMDMEIIGVEIHSPRQLQERLTIISNNADALLAIPDQTVYSGRTAKEVLLFSYRNRIPFVGLSSSWVKAGALYALEVDYEHLGLLCAEKAKKIIEGQLADTIPLSSPTMVTYTINERTEKYLRLEFSPGLIHGASRIFE